MSDFVALQDLTDSIAPRLVSAKHWSDATFINLPMLYPSGAFVTVRLSHAKDGIRVSDSGFAYREAESFGMGRSFARTARSLAEFYSVEVGSRSIFADVRAHEVERAIMDVSAASHATAKRILEKADDEGEIEMSEMLLNRLDVLFPSVVHKGQKVTGASSTEWDVTAVAKFDRRSVVFQAVSNSPISVYKASTAFHDLSALENAPECVAVIPSKAVMGPNVGILNQAGRVIEIGQSDAVYRRVAA